MMNPFIFLGRRVKKNICGLSFLEYRSNHRQAVIAKKNISGKYFIEIENSSSHRVLETSTGYEKTIVKDPSVSISRLNELTTPNSVFKYFSVVTSKNEECLSLEDRQFDVLADELASYISKASYHDVMCTLCNLTLWPPSPKTYARNFKAIWNAADRECTERLKVWSVDQKLLMADYWYHLGLSRISNYNIHMIKNLISEHDFLTCNQIVHLMFCVNLQRSIPQNLLNPIEKRLGAIIKDISLPEISVICLGFFKTETQLNNLNTIKIIIDRLVEDADNISNSAVIGILKCLRKSLHHHITEFYVPLLQKLAVNIHRWDVPAAIHSGLLCASTNIYEPLLLDTVSDKIRMCLPDVRIKDIYKVLQCLSAFNHVPSEDFNETMCKELLKKSREMEIWQHSRDLVFISLFFAYLGFYDAELLQTVFDPAFVAHCQKKFHDVMNVFAVIDYCIQIEFSSYTGPRLNVNILRQLEKQRGNLGNVNSSASQQKSIQANLTVKAFETFKELYGKENVCVRHVLPHMFNPDILVRLHSSKRLRTSKVKCLFDIVKSYPSDMVFKPPHDETWACAVICDNFTYAFRSNNLSALMNMKRRQLELLGYKVYMISHKEIPSNSNQRRSILAKKFKTFNQDVS